MVAIFEPDSSFAKVWNVETKELIVDIESNTSVYDVQLSLDGRLACIRKSEEVFIYDLKDKTLLLKIMKRNATNSIFTKNSKFLVYSHGNIIYFLDLEKNKEVTSLRCEKSRFGELSLSENGEYLIVPYQGRIDIYSLKNLHD
jgi:WD40 repeat protein